MRTSAAPDPWARPRTDRETMKNFPGITKVAYKVGPSTCTLVPGLTDDLPAGDLLRRAEPRFYIAAIDELLEGETDQEVIDALLDRRNELTREVGHAS